jgi:predicted TIM-barrel fold metal-dependent hydrolase
MNLGCAPGELTTSNPGGSDMTEPYMVDADGHVIEPIDMWTSRMSLEQWGEWIPRYVAEDPDADQEESWYFAGVRRAGGQGSLILACSAGMDADQIARDHPRLMDGRRGAWDPDARIAELDEEGIDAAVLYPSLTMFFGPSDPIEGLRNVEFVLDCQRAYNDWLAEYCGAHPDRLFGMAAVPAATRRRPRSCRGEPGSWARFERRVPATVGLPRRTAVHPSQL